MVALPDLTSDLGELVGVEDGPRFCTSWSINFQGLNFPHRFNPSHDRCAGSNSRSASFLSSILAFTDTQQNFHLLVERCCGETILHHENFSLKSNSDERMCIFVVLRPSSTSTSFGSSQISWLHSSSVFANLVQHYDVPASSLRQRNCRPSAPATQRSRRTRNKLFGFKRFNPIQTQTFHRCLKRTRSYLVCTLGVKARLFVQSLRYFRCSRTRKANAYMLLRQTGNRGSLYSRRLTDRFGSCFETVPLSD
jgi:hypothetical protein